MVTAELAMAVPALVAVVGMLAWLLSLGATQSLVAQAAREGARTAARGEGAAAVRSAVHGLVPGASVAVRRSGSHVVVIASVRRRPPIRLLQPLTREVRASAVTWWEGP
jgi:hypothetical protein